MSSQKRTQVPSGGINPTVLARCIELRPASLPLTGEMTDEQVRALCRGAIEHGLRAVSVPMEQVERALRYVKGSLVDVSALIGAPTGVLPGEVKIREALEVTRRGAGEITVMLDAECFRARWGKQKEECDTLNELVRVCHACNGSVVVKTLLHVGCLTESECRAALAHVGALDVDFVGVIGDICAEGSGVDPVTTVQAVLQGKRGTLVWNGLFDTVERAREETPEELDVLRVSALEDMIRTVQNEEHIVLSTVNGVSLVETAHRLYAEGW